MANRNEWTADRRLYLDRDGNVVEANDPKRARLLVAAGNTIPIEDAERLGLLSKQEEKAAPARPNKASPGPSENKATGEPDAPMPNTEEAGDAGQGVTEGEGTPEQLDQFDALNTPPGQDTLASESDVEFIPVPALEEAVAEPPKRKRGQ